MGSTFLVAVTAGAAKNNDFRKPLRKLPKGLVWFGIGKRPVELWLKEVERVGQLVTQQPADGGDFILRQRCARDESESAPRPNCYLGNNAEGNHQARSVLQIRVVGHARQAQATCFNRHDVVSQDTAPEAKFRGWPEGSLCGPTGY